MAFCFVFPGHGLDLHPSTRLKQKHAITGPHGPVAESNFEPLWPVGRGKSRCLIGPHSEEGSTVVGAFHYERIPTISLFILYWGAKLVDASVATSGFGVPVSSIQIPKRHQIDLLQWMRYILFQLRKHATATRGDEVAVEHV